MSRKDKDSPACTVDPGQQDKAGPHKDGLSHDLKKDASHRRGAVRADEAAGLKSDAAPALSLVTAREAAVYLREEAALQREVEAEARENVALTREVELDLAATRQSQSDEQMHMLQQANSRLVVATIEAHKLAEQVQSVKVQLDHLAHHDALTDLPNRILLQDRLNQAIELAQRQNRQLAVMYLDLDQFKHINDSLGHALGDQLLRSVAQRLVASVRHSDTISRQGGDEFILLLPYIEHAEDAVLSANKVLETLSLPHQIQLHNLHITASIGISIFPNDGQDAESLIKSADIAMYSAKENGRNNFKFFEQGMNVRASKRQSIETGLRMALERKEFVLYYQPRINLYTGTIVGAEALIRWQHPQFGLLLPAEFVSVAEDSGLILPIGHWALCTACAQAQAWLKAGLPPITFAVNTSALEFRAKNFLANICAILKETGLKAGNLELELTETVLMRNAKSTDSTLHALKDMGIKLTVDDFGTGFSSLSYLRQFPIDALKIDQSFVHNMTQSADDASIVMAVISLGKNLKQRVIAEGVETAEQYAFLQAQHCDEGQGHYFSHPVPAKEFAKLLGSGISENLLHPVFN